MTLARPADTLARVGLFRSLTPDEIARLNARCLFRRAHAKDWIIDYQDESTDVFFLISGSARVMIRAISGRETILREIESGAFFGEFSAIDGRPRSASILAITDVTIAKMTAAVFLETVTLHADVCLQLLRLITGEVRVLSNRVNEFTTLAIRERLIMELLRLSRGSSAAPGQAIVSPPPLHADLAGRISTRRETVTKELSAMEREGLVLRGRRALTLIDVPRLIGEIRAAEEAQDFDAAAKPKSSRPKSPH